MALADSHMHIFAPGFPGRYGALFPKGGELATYEAISKVHEIDRALVVGYEGDPWAAGNNRHIAKLAKDHSWMAPVAFVAGEPSLRQLQQWWQAGFYGIVLYLNTDADCENVLSWGKETLDALNEKKAIISINAPITNIARLRPFFQSLPETRILLSHLGLPGAISPKTTAASASRLLAPLKKQGDLTHVGVKLSGFYACNAYPHTGVTPIVDTIRESFDDRRLYWASDFVPALDDVSFTQTIDGLRLHLAKGAQTKAIFHDNLHRIIERVATTF